MNKFIVIEGIDGSGKDTQVDLLHKNLKNSYKDNEPTSSKLGKLIREELCSPKNEFGKNRDKYIGFLISANRFEHLYKDDGILKRLEKQDVILSRYILSTLAYNGKELIELNKSFPIPTFTFLIDIPIDVSMERIKQRNIETEKPIDFYENEKHLTEIRNNYLEQFNEYKKWYPDKFFIIDGLKSKEDIQKEILEIIEK